ncbi:MAG: TIGR03066 family protein [Gemmataceae bacterium]|nr:TIGR03066 family protein [Gemmataceae bacterium]
MRTLFGAGLVVGLALAATAAPADDPPAKIDGKKLVGKWRPTGKNVAEGVKAVIEFTKDGKVAIEMEKGEQKKSVKGAYKLTGDKLALSLDRGGKEDKETMTVTKLTDDDLVMEDPKGKVDTFKRVKEADEKEKK